MKKKQIEHINLLRKIAWSFHRSTGIDFDDLFQEAYLAYNYAMKTYDPKRGKITTYLWWCIGSELKRYVKREREAWGVVVSFDDEPATYALPDHQEPASVFLDSLTEEARELAAIILSAPKIFIEIPPPDAKQRLANVLVRKGWRWRDIWIGMKDMESACS
jgi:RNA polymerase sigma factor (sigma-70 family)